MAMPPAPESEASLLHRAREALGSTPAQTLELAAAHARLHPGGVLGQERELLVIEALVRLGRVSEANRRARQLLDRFPGTAYRRRLLVLMPDLAPEP